MRRWPVCLAVWGLSLSAAWGLPTVDVSVDTSTVTVGDPVELTLRMRFHRDERPLMPDLSAWLQGFSVRERGRAESRETEEGKEWTRRFELRLYELGEKWIPSLSVPFVRSGGDTLVCASDSIEVRVVSARSGKEEEPRDIKPPVRISGGLPLWTVVLAGLALLAVLGFVARRILRRKREQGTAPPPEEPVDYAAEFVRIAGLGLVERGEYKEYYSLLSDNLRRYLEQSVGVEAMERTTSEISAALQESALDPGIIRRIEEFLGFADLVKFARFIPQIEQARRAPESGVGIVRAVDRFLAERAAAQALASEERETGSDSGEPEGEREAGE